MIPPEQWAAAWSEHPSTTIQQAAGAERDLEAWLGGAPHDSFDAFRKMMTPIMQKFESLLEIGCGSGIYSQVLRALDSTKKYIGCDISVHMIEYARKRWPGFSFHEDVSNFLQDGDAAYDVTCISGLIQHLADYRPSIKEAARVARQYVVLHRVECTIGPNEEFIRHAYDSDIPTRRCNDDELLFFCGMQKLRLEKTAKWSMGHKTYNASFLFTKMQ